MPPGSRAEIIQGSLLREDMSAEGTHSQRETPGGASRTRVLRFRRRTNSAGGDNRIGFTHWMLHKIPEPMDKAVTQ